MSPDGELIAFLAVLHGAGLLLAAGLLLLVFRAERRSDRSGPDEDDGGGGNDRVPPAVPRRPGDGGLPLPSAQPARMRLRDHRRLAELLPAFPPRRSHPATPQRPPDRTPTGR